MAGYALDHVAVAVNDMDAAARFFAEGLRLPRIDDAAGDGRVPVFAIGRAAVALHAPDDPALDGRPRTGLRHIALATDNPVAAARRHGLAAAAPRRGLAGAEEVAVDPSATCGIATRFVQADGRWPGHAGPVSRIDHIGIASDDIDAVARVFAAGMGCPVESRQTDLEIRTASETFVSDRYPAVHHTRPPQIVGGLRSVFITVGDCELEALQDYDPGQSPDAPGRHGPGDTKGDQSAIARFVARHGPGLHHLALKVDDIDLLLAGLERGGFRLIDRTGRPGGRASRIGFVHPATFGGGLVVHFVERAGP